MATYHAIALTEFRTVLHKWVETVDRGEVAFTWALPSFPHIVLKVYTSIPHGETVTREVGADAIRVCAVDTKANRGWIKAARVHRVKGWRDNLKTRVQAVREASYERLGATVKA